MPARLQVLLVAAMLMAGCAAVPPTPVARGVTEEMLLAARPIVGSRSLLPLPEADVLGLDPEMRAFLARFVDKKDAHHIRAQNLLRALMQEGIYRVEYDDQTHTAAETFHTKSGNCVSFTNLFVAMAREVGIDAHFQEVEIPPDWTLEGGAFVLNRHINVLVKLTARGDYVVDFNFDEFRTSYERRAVRDERALAHYYNNIGVDHMQADDAVEALRYFRKAIEYDRRFSAPWGNLGTLYRRNGSMAYAEAAYLQALAANSNDSVAMSNLAALYKQLGDAERATTYRQRVETHRMRNPYYRYRLGREAFLAGDYERAIDHLRYAIKRKKNEDDFYLLLGLSYHQSGDTRNAQRWLARAEDASARDDLIESYYDQIQKLLSTSQQE